MLPDQARTALLLLVVGLPATSFLVLGALGLVHRPPSERATAALTAATFVLALSASVVSMVLVAQNGPFEASAGSMFAISGYELRGALLVDQLSGTMAILTTSILGLVGYFSRTYLHREPGFARFFLLLHLFAVGMLLIVLAANIDLLFAGWEIVGITSVLLIAFYQERDAPVRRGLAAFVTYRACDVGLLLAAVLLHRFAHTTELHVAFPDDAVARGASQLTPVGATIVALLLLVGSLGKGAQLPASGWLPRAMEGPTPSSALFYGALSVHAAVYLLIRTAPIFAEAPIARAALVGVGLSTAVYGTLVGRVQSDAKNTLAYATMTQVGVMFAEVGLGLYTLAVMHLVGHACVRTLQLLRAPSALHEAHILHSGLGEHPHTGAHFESFVPERLRHALYRHAIDGFHLDALVTRFIAAPVMRLAARVDGFGRWLHGVLIGIASNRQSPRVLTSTSPAGGRLTKTER